MDPCEGETQAAGGAASSSDLGSSEGRAARSRAVAGAFMDAMAGAAPTGAADGPISSSSAFDSPMSRRVDRAYSALETEEFPPPPRAKPLLEALRDRGVRLFERADFGSFEPLLFAGVSGGSSSWDGEMYTGTLAADGARFTIKIISSGGLPLNDSEFCRFIDASRHIFNPDRHEHIAKIYGCVVLQAADDGPAQHGFVMEPLEETAASRFVHPDVKLVLLEGCQVLRDVCAALDYMYKVENLLHLDVTRFNVLITKEGRGKLIDCGHSLVRAGNSSELTARESPARPGGNYLYIAPEIWNGYIPTTLSDSYSFALLACEVLTGMPIWRDAPSAHDVSARVGASGHQPRLLVGVPDELSRLLNHGCAMDLRSRPRVEDFLAVLEAIIEDIHLYSGARDVATYGYRGGSDGDISVLRAPAVPLVDLADLACIPETDELKILDVVKELSARANDVLLESGERRDSPTRGLFKILQVHWKNAPVAKVVLENVAYFIVQQKPWDATVLENLDLLNKIASEYITDPDRRTGEQVIVRWARLFHRFLSWSPNLTADRRNLLLRTGCVMQQFAALTYARHNIESLLPTIQDLTTSLKIVSSGTDASAESVKMQLAQHEPFLPSILALLQLVWSMASSKESSNQIAEGSASVIGELAGLAKEFCCGEGKGNRAGILGSFFDLLQSIARARGVHRPLPASAREYVNNAIAQREVASE